MKQLAWHFDFHSHREIRINHDPDTAGAARELKRAGVEEIITFAKGHDGYAYYPSKIGFPHPRMKGDAFGDLVRACKKKGIRVLAYVSFGIDGEAGRAHPEWAQVGPGGPETSEDWFISVCPFTPYLDESLLPMIDEILKLYPVDGFFFDTMGALGVCHCAHCEQAFQAAHGHAIPRADDDPLWGAYGTFRHTRGMAMLRRVGDFIRERKADAKIGFNHIGTLHYPEPVSDAVSCLTLDFSTAGHQSRQASLCAALGSTADLPADVMPTIFNQGWGDWSPRPAAALEQVGAAILARDCRLYFGDRLRPENRLDQITVNALRNVSGMMKKMRKVYPADGTRQTPDIVLLHGPGAMYGTDMSWFARHRDGLAPLAGAHHLLLDVGANFAAVMEHVLEPNLAGNPLVILPEMPAISRKTAERLTGYVEQGGKVLLVGTAPSVEGRPFELAGIQKEEKPWQGHDIYLPAWPGADDGQPVLVRGDFHKITPGDAEMVLPAIQPYDCRHGLRFGWGIGPASKEPSPYPALTRRSLGRGEAWFLEPRIFTSYHADTNWTLIAWVRDLLTRLVPAPAARVISPAGTVELVVHADERSTWLFLVNHGGEQFDGTYSWARTFEPLPAFPLSVEVHSRSRQAPSLVTRNNRPVKKWDFSDGTVRFPLKMDAIWTVIRLDW